MLGAEPRSANGNLVLFSSGPLWPSVEHSSAAKLWRPGAAQLRHVALNDPATLVVTDFTREPPATVTEDRPIDDALQDMMVAGVRALVVVRGDLVSGLVTSYDVQGERPLQFLRASSYTRHDEIEVRHIMTPWDRVPKLDWSRLSVARVRDVADLFSKWDASHLVVVEYVMNNGVFVRALISRTRLHRQLGHQID
jgi:CBS-domain-containing membrane protein